MKTLYGMVLKAFIPVFLITILFFILILQLVELFGNLPNYINNEVPLLQVLLVSLYYLPKCTAFAIPISLLFSISYTLGNFYSNNELIAIFGSGISLVKIAFPFMFAGVLLSGVGFLFEEEIVIPSYRLKNELTKELLNQSTSFSNTNVTVLSHNNIIYHVNYYNDNSSTLSGLIILERDENGSFFRRIDAELARWNGEVWEMNNCRLFSWNDDGSFIDERNETLYIQDNINESPSTFRKAVRNIDEMQTRDAKIWIESLRKAGLPTYKKVLTDYYVRFSFALTPFVVALISSSIGGRFKKNILLMSLLTSLSISVIYYVSRMITILFAKEGYITPVSGAWSSFIFFLITGIWLFKIAKT